MKLEEAINRCRLACGSEAVARGLPVELGYDFHDGAIADDLNGWTDDRFLIWIDAIKAKYRLEEKPMMALYEECNEILGRYASLLAGCDRDD